MKFHITLKSDNAKTGPILVTTQSAETCPPACPFINSGCYAKSGPLNLHWGKVSDGNRGTEWSAFLTGIESGIVENTVWRYGQAGDLPGVGNAVDGAKLAQLTAVNASKASRGFGYTHKPVTTRDASGDRNLSRRNLRAIARANRNGLTINLSGNSPAHADRLASTAKGAAPIVCVVPMDTPAVSHTPAGRKIIICPAQQREGISCATCRLCSVSSRSVIVGFRAHGTGARKAAQASALSN